MRHFHTRDHARLLRVAEKLDYGVIGANVGIHQRGKCSVRRREGTRLWFVKVKHSASTS